MTKKEIIDKVYDDCLRDYGRVGYIGMNSIEKACKSEFEKMGLKIKPSHSRDFSRELGGSAF